MNLSKQIAIIDYGMGNIHSIQNAVKLLGFESEVVQKGSDAVDVSHMILPGVGAYPDAINRLRAEGLDKAIIRHAEEGKALLGICLGMQLLFSESEENGLTAGLSLIPGVVKRFPFVRGYSVPQVQWNHVVPNPKSYLLGDISGEDYFYFLHSYYASVDDAIVDSAIVSTSNYCEIDYCSAIEFDNVYATQFHPEKSAQTGHKIIKKFLAIGD